MEHCGGSSIANPPFVVFKATKLHVNQQRRKPLQQSVQYRIYLYVVYNKKQLLTLCSDKHT